MRTDDLEDVIAWRRQLHSKPELAFEERETAEFIARQLSAWGLSVKTGIAGTGVVGTLSRGSSGRTIGIRACLLYTSPSPRDLSTSRMPSAA